MDTMESLFNSNFNRSEVKYEEISYNTRNPIKENSPPKEKVQITEKIPKKVDEEKPKTTIKSTQTVDISNNDVLKPPPKKPILDPLSVIVKLAILSNKPVGTKILMKDYVIHIQEPGIFQGLTRYINKTNRNDLQYLYNPIQLACKRYMNREYRRQNPRIVDLFICAQFGLLRLMDTYHGNTVIKLCLNYYYSLIENYVKEIYSPIFRDDDLTELYTEQLQHNLNEIWTQEKIKIILDMIHFLSDDKMANDNVKTLDIFIQNIDKHTQVILSLE